MNKNSLKILIGLTFSLLVMVGGYIFWFKGPNIQSVSSFINEIPYYLQIKKYMIFSQNGVNDVVRSQKTNLNYAGGFVKQKLKTVSGDDLDKQYYVVKGYVRDINLKNRIIIIDIDYVNHTLMKVKILDNIPWVVNNKQYKGDYLKNLNKNSYINASCVDSSCKQLNAITVN